MSSLVEIYTRNHCPHCRRAKDLLRIKGVSFKEHDVTAVSSGAESSSSQGSFHAMPRIFINDVPIGGCDELFELDEQGMLNQMLGLNRPLAGSLP